MEENGRLVQFLYNEDREVVAEKDCSGNIIRYIRGLGLISSDSENAKTYYHYVSDEQGSVSHIIRDEDKESGVSAQGREQDRILNQYEYDAFGNTISCKEQVENRFRYMGEQYDPLTGQYYLRARYYNPVIARFTQEDTYYGDGLNLYTYCRNNPILNHDPTGHGTKENSPYSRKEQQYIDAGADPDTAKLATQCYPDANSKQDLYNKYKSQGYNATDAKKLANYEIVHGEERAKNYAANNVKKSGPDYTATSPRDNVNTDWRTQERLNAQKKASNSQLMPMNLQFFAAKGDESGSKSGSSSRYDRTGYQSKGRSNNLFGRDRSTRRTTNLTEWRRSISQQDIHNEMRLFLGDDYVKIDSGKWRSLDGTRQFRVKPDDYLGNHGIGQPTVPNTPHVHFEFLTPKSNGNGFDVIKNIHVPIK